MNKKEQEEKVWWWEFYRKQDEEKTKKIARLEKESKCLFRVHMVLDSALEKKEGK